ncbi:MAG: hypothetical protein IH874_02730 [Candidatus Dadabacteria bacterium]|nr:hypothetical protein [Candidatus Dadabacteria bacterium]
MPPPKGGRCAAGLGAGPKSWRAGINGSQSHDPAAPRTPHDEVCDGGFDDGGGGGRCAIASAGSAGTMAADALVVLIPLLGIGLRSMLRRRKRLTLYNKVRAGATLPS